MIPSLNFIVTNSNLVFNIAIKIFQNEFVKKINNILFLCTLYFDKINKKGGDVHEI